ncbi:MAG: SemiSWEET transporter [Bacteroidota bacterium]|nr:SemiSWEET transporter [Bacteroidota bacterium]
MDFVEGIGYLAAIITTAGFVPQTVKAIKTRQTKDISLWMYIILLVGIILWLLYGIFTDSWPIILANGVTILLVIPVLVLKIKC